jgi:hypothetical protein
MGGDGDSIGGEGAGGAMAAAWTLTRACAKVLMLMVGRDTAGRRRTRPARPGVIRRPGLIAVGALLSSATLGTAPPPPLACPTGASAPSGISGSGIVKVADDRVIHRFFDTSPISPSGRTMALLRFPDETRSPKPGDVADVILIDLVTRRERTIARTRGWEMQLGAHVQWGASDRQLFFSDVDLATWKAKTILLDPASGRRRTLDGPLFMVSPDGRSVAGHDMATSRFAQVGYGVVVPDSAAPRVFGPSPDNGVFVTDVRTGRSRLVASAAAIYAQAKPSLKIADPSRFEYYVFQVKWNPQGTRLLVSFQWTPKGGGPRGRAAVTMRPDGSDIRTAITPAQWALGGHHIAWMADGEHVSMNLPLAAGAPLSLISVRYDGSDLKTIFPLGSGHPSQHPRGLPLFITDAYPDEPLTRRDGTVPLRLINLATQTEKHVATVYVSNTGGEFRIDPHPAWDRTGRYVTFNGYVGCTRNVWVIDLKDEVARIRR